MTRKADKEVKAASRSSKIRKVKRNKKHSGKKRAGYDSFPGNVGEHDEADGGPLSDDDDEGELPEQEAEITQVTSSFNM
jgi:hypothetical protein